ncbi:MAG: 50S ribosomal protein L29 [Thermoproteota archaeon]|jgi:large subunit ribosomal protein L29|nr:50S ribosomal protein L29 [Thermoproteota archaeon]MEC9033165.1 50S ribosomal protein L29 [Thermoproteota archaeon]MEC9063276.1 50S ribosomal protein L29 [Thermoproteota archaeon]MEC9073587.1 50S ribosomal protein L29 [Thermoproteota archaeon]MEC9416771.1 50S ribosomal protein L29 [Thermoproteota archaeon]|tara:strand:- start:1361 stop:1564 length:204 start_codon:yes stop_codon:yes gene_type:complete
MAMLKMKSIRELNEKDLRDRVEQMKTELSKLQTENAKGTLRKETGKIRKVKKEIARLLTRLNEVKKN